MTATNMESSTARPSHQVSGRDYPGEWARQIECNLDKEARRITVYGGLFALFVLAVVIVAVIGVIGDRPPI
jgi:hypothetical protein